ncbi:NADH-quinone oxidoreductase subunit L [Thermithiobacillus plumbiphilus]|uniref:Proton-conducting transporter membrane subunit n=1 Tax=Thermithiobacillus plumbiphilus TaxID=1729899 RepID=A0ABU9D6H7_9PROT
MVTNLLWLLPALPLGLGVLLLAGGHRFDRLAGILSAIGAFSTLLLALWALQAHPTAVWPWLPLGNRSLPLTLAATPLSAAMAVLVSALATLILIYALAYMAKDPSRARFFGLMSLFLGSMLLLVLADDLLALLIAWESVGACSYALIGFWYTEAGRPPAANRAFLSTRFADIGLYLAAMAAFAVTGGFSFASLATLSGWPLQLVVGGLILAALGKSAQLPFSGWLSGAMLGPSPVSALLHSATMVAAGAFLLTKLLPVLMLTTWAQPLLLWVGGLTVLTGALIALYQDEIKQILAASTLSQYGYIFAALGAADAGAATLHLFSHALFKALLFLAAGVLVHSGLQRLQEMGGLRRPMPWTAAAFGIGALSLAAIPPLGGFFSKELILAAVSEQNRLLGIFLMLGAFLTAVYIARAWLLAFAGNTPVNPSNPQKADTSMRLAMGVLIVLVLFSGLLAWPPIAGASGVSAAIQIMSAETMLSLGLVLLGLLWSWRRHVSGRLLHLPKFGVLGAAAGQWFGLLQLSDGVGRLGLRLAQQLAKADDQLLARGVQQLPKLTLHLGEWSRRADREGWDRLIEGMANSLSSGSRVLSDLQNGLLHRYYLWMVVSMLLLLALTFWTAGV